VRRRKRLFGARRGKMLGGMLVTWNSPTETNYFQFELNFTCTSPVKKTRDN